MPQDVPLLVQVGIPGLAVAVAGAFLVAAWSSASPGERPRQRVVALLGVLSLFVVTGGAALSGALADTARRPPPFLLVLVLATAVTVVAARSSLGQGIATRVPLWALVGAQGFRFPLELVMHRAASAGVMPPEMSFGGLNYDIATGIAAIAVGVALYRGVAPRALVLAWNVMGSLLLAIIVAVALAATPTVQAFGPLHLNTWVLHFPYVWLPTVLVQAALFGHIVIFRRLLADRPHAENGNAAASSTRA